MCLWYDLEVAVVSCCAIRRQRCFSTFHLGVFIAQFYISVSVDKISWCSLCCFLYISALSFELWAYLSCTIYFLNSVIRGKIMQASRFLNVHLHWQVNISCLTLTLKYAICKVHYDSIMISLSDLHLKSWRLLFFIGEQQMLCSSPKETHTLWNCWPLDTGPNSDSSLTSN